TRRRIAFAGAGALVVAGLAFAAVQRGDRDPCEAAEQPIAGVWAPLSRASVEQAFAASRAPGAAAAFDRVDHLLAERAVALRDARHEACAATEVRHEQSADLLDRRMQCIDQRASATTAL